jgi:hypothetical protein
MISELSFSEKQELCNLVKKLDTEEIEEIVVLIHASMSLNSANSRWCLFYRLSECVQRYSREILETGIELDYIGAELSNQTSRNCARQSE